MKKKRLFLMLLIVIATLAFTTIAYAAFTSGTVFETQMQMPDELQALM